LQVLNVFCAGAAQAVVSDLAAALEREGTHLVAAQYGAVHALKSRIVAGEPADAVILTDQLIDELISLGLVVPGSRADLGSVPTGIAVRRGAPVPEIGSIDELRTALRGAARIVCPDPAVASAGRALLEALTRLEILAELRPRLVYCPSGYAAIAELLRGGDADLGVMQLTEIRAHDGVTLVGALPPELQQTAVIYAAGLAARTAQPQVAAAFIRRLASGDAALRAAGFGAVPPVAARP
jgi:molybdate transport system substrate-binding protein